jgi:hypothetical protein
MDVRDERPVLPPPPSTAWAPPPGVPDATGECCPCLRSTLLPMSLVCTLTPPNKVLQRTGGPIPLPKARPRPHVSRRPPRPRHAVPRPPLNTWPLARRPVRSEGTELCRHPPPCILRETH